METQQDVTWEEEEFAEEGGQGRPLTLEAGGSVLDTIRKRRDALAGEHHLDIQVPGYNGCLVIRCGPIDPAKLAKARDRMTRAGAISTDFGWAADLIIDSCQEVMGRRRPEDPLEPLVPGETLRINHDLAEHLNLQIPSGRARDLLTAIFSLAPSPQVAIERAQLELYQWSSGAEAEVEGDLLGE